MTGFQVDEPFLFVGRTFQEYCRMFGLQPASLAGQSVLDCPGGPSSFSAVAGEIAETTIAIDPMYGQRVEVLQRECRDAIERTLDQLREKRELFVWEEYGDVETRGRYLRAAAALAGSRALGTGRSCRRATPRDGGHGPLRVSALRVPARRDDRAGPDGRQRRGVSPPNCGGKHYS